MKDDFIRNVARAVMVLVALIVLDRLPIAVVPNVGYLPELIADVRNEAWHADDFHARAANYYEGVEHGVRIAVGSENDDYRLRDDFMRYEFKPNLKRRYSAGMRVTNSLGMANPEYGYEKSARTRRIAVLGDSISVGPYGQDYETLLEHRLNQEHRTPETQNF